MLNALLSASSSHSPQPNPSMGHNPTPWSPYSTPPQGPPVPIDPLEIEKKKRQDALNLLLSQIQAPQQTNPLPSPVDPLSRFGTKDLLTGIVPLLGLLLSGNSKAIPEFAQGYVGAKQNEAQGMDQRNMLKYQQDQQQAQQQRQSGIDASKIGYEAANDDLALANSTYQNDARRNAANDIELLKQKYKADAAARATEARQKLEETKAMMRQMSPDIRAAYAKQFGYSPDVQQAVGELTIEEQAKAANTEVAKAKVPNINANTDYTKAKTQTENDTRAGKVAKLDGELDKIRSGIQKDSAQIEKWEKDAALAGRKENRMGQEFEWRKATQDRPSPLDKKLEAARQYKIKLQASADEWRKQGNVSVGGVSTQVPTKGSGDAIAKIQREMAATDAILKRLKALGAKEYDVTGTPQPVVSPVFGGVIGDGSGDSSDAGARRSAGKTTVTSKPKVKPSMPKGKLPKGWSLG